MASPYEPVLEFDHSPDDPELSFLEGQNFAAKEVTEAELSFLFTNRVWLVMAGLVFFYIALDHVSFLYSRLVTHW